MMTSHSKRFGGRVRRAARWIYLLLSACALGDALLRLGMLDLSGPAAVWSNLAFGYWLVLTMFLVQWGIGRALFHLPDLRRCEAPPVLMAVFQGAVGAYVSYGFLMILGLFNALNGPGFAMYLLLAIGLTLMGLLSGRRTPRATIGDCGLTIEDSTSDRQSSRVNPQSAIVNPQSSIPIPVLAAGFIWAIPYVAMTLLPNMDWDTASHHVPIAKAYLERGIWPMDESYPAFSYPGAVHLFYSLFVFLGGESGIIPLNFATCVVLLLAVYALTAHVWGRRAGAWAAAVCLPNNIIWEVGLTARIDTFLAFFCLLACGAFLLWLRAREQTGWLLVCGAMLGVAMGTKYSAAFFAVALGPAVLVQLLRNSGRQFRGRIALLLLFVACASFPSIGWYARNAAQFGDPMYSHLRGPIYHDASGRRVRMNPQLRDAVALGFASPEIREYVGTLPEEDAAGESPTTLFNPYSIFVHPDHHARRRYHTVTPFLLLFFALPFFQRDRLSMWVFALGGTTFALIGSQTFLLRYALPVVPLLSIGAGLCLAKVRSRRMITGLVAALATFSFFVAAMEMRRLVSKDPLAYWSGRSERIEWVANAGYNDMRPTPRVVGFINEQIEAGGIPRDTTLFMVGESKGNLLACRYLPDGSRNAQRLMAEFLKAGGDYDEMARSFKEQGIGYFLWNRGYLGWCLNYSNARYEDVAFSLYHFDQFRERHIETIHEDQSVGLGKLKGEEVPEE